jgi:hypothetical protein
MTCAQIVSLGLVMTITMAITGTAVAQSVDDPRPCQKVVVGTAPVPEDFHIILGSGPRMASRGVHTVRTILASGAATIQSKRRGETSSLDRFLTQAELRRLDATIRACDFFSLKESYSKPGSHDGGVTSITVTANGRKHGVAVGTGVSVERFRTLVDAIDKLLDR